MKWRTPSRTPARTRQAGAIRDLSPSGNSWDPVQQYRSEIIIVMSRRHDRGFLALEEAPRSDARDGNQHVIGHE
eukprot:727318-Hanusia_phi.AAC.1